MKTISFSDTIFATVNICGRVIYNSSIEGMNSIEEIIRYISNSVRGIARGMVTVLLRNGSQGWTMRRNIRLNAVAEGTQLQLAI